MDDEDGERRVRAKQAGDKVEEVDRLRNLPDCLLFQILLKLPTKDVVKCSVLSRRWRNIWRYVPGLDFECRDFMASCPVLESLTVNNGNLKYLQVCSQSLLTFTHVEDEGYMTVAIDAPRLEYLRLSDKGLESLIIECHGSLVKADIDTVFDFSLKNEFDPNDLPTTHMIRDFLVGISCVKDMIISSSTLEQVIYDYSRCEKLPLFCNISFLRVEFTDDRWEMLPIFLESCPNLKSLVLEFCTCPEEEKVVILPGPRRFLTSLEYVKIVKSDSEEEEEATEINLELVSYLLENSAILKKLTLCLGYLRRREESVILRKLLTIPRLSTSCQVFVL